MRKYLIITLLFLISIFYYISCSTLDFNSIDIEYLIKQNKGNIYQKDFLYFVQKLKEIHPAFIPNEYAYVYDDDFKKFACEIYKDLGKGPFNESENESNRSKFCYLTTKLLSKIKDGHLYFSTIHYFFGNSDKTLPIITRWFEDKLYIIDTIDDYGFLKNKEITKIGSAEVNRIRSEIDEFISGDNNYFKRNINGFILCRKSVLELLDLVKDESKVEIEYINNGETKIETLELKKWKGYRNKIEEISRWNIGRNEDFFSNGEEIWFREFKEYNTMFVQVNHFTNFDNFTYECKKFLKEVKEKNIKNIVLDLRSNYGGNFLIAREIIGKYFSLKAPAMMDSFFGVERVSKEWCLGFGFNPDNYQDEIKNEELLYFLGEYIKSEPDKLAFDGNLYVLIGNMSLSTATIFTGIIKDNKLGILIGEPTGSASSFFAGREFITVNLPNSGIDLEINYAIFVRTNKEARFKEPDAVYPDVYVPTTFEDYINGKDPCWEYLVDNVFSKQKN